MKMWCLCLGVTAVRMCCPSTHQLHLLSWNVYFILSYFNAGCILGLSLDPGEVSTLLNASYSLLFLPQNFQIKHVFISHLISSWNSSQRKGNRLGRPRIDFPALHFARLMVLDLCSHFLMAEVERERNSRLPSWGCGFFPNTSYKLPGDPQIASVPEPVCHWWRVDTWKDQVPGTELAVSLFALISQEARNLFKEI